MENWTLGPTSGERDIRTLRGESVMMGRSRDELFTFGLPS